MAFICPMCETPSIKVNSTLNKNKLVTTRLLQCPKCHQKFVSIETLIVKDSYSSNDFLVRKTYKDNEYFELFQSNEILKSITNVTDVDESKCILCVDKIKRMLYRKSRGDVISLNTLIIVTTKLLYTFFEDGENIVDKKFIDNTCHQVRRVHQSGFDAYFINDIDYTKKIQNSYAYKYFEHYFDKLDLNAFPINAFNIYISSDNLINEIFKEIILAPTYKEITNNTDVDIKKYSL